MVRTLIKIVIFPFIHLKFIAFIHSFLSILQVQAQTQEAGEEKRLYDAEQSEQTEKGGEKEK